MSQRVDVAWFIALDDTVVENMSAADGAVVYAGRGSSHSWTWLADLFEDSGFLSVRFLDRDVFVEACRSDEAETAIISGGDGFAVAEALKGDGFRELERWISRGGSFVGICAGAYLPLPSSIEPFSEFNLSSTKIENINCDYATEADFKPRFEIPYGNCSIVHPVRGPVELEDGSGNRVTAPLFGGPVFREPEKDTVVMRYLEFTGETEIQSDLENARRIILGKPGIIRSIHAGGSLLLFGPHLEHPRFPKANDYFLDLLGILKQKWVFQEAVGSKDKERHKALHRAIADLKVAVYGLENRSFVVGRKAWDGGRYLELISAMEKRMWTLSDQDSRKIESALSRVREKLVGMKVGEESDADEATRTLVEAARVCIDSHFVSLASARPAPSDDLFGLPRTTERR